MFTERGWASLGAGLALIVLWFLLGEVELLGAGILAVVAALVGLALTRLSSTDIDVTRLVEPSEVHEGDTVEVRASFTNRARRTAFNLTVVESVGSLGEAEFSVGSIDPKATVEATYRIVCRPRGIYPVGPARVRVFDPMGMARLDTSLSGSSRLVIYPAVEDLVGLPLARARNPSMHSSKPEFSSRGGEDFYTLREYVPGDDLRYVHWPSSAKRDQLLIRQLETPLQARALVMLDVRKAAYGNSECFEQAVRGAASVIRHLSRSGFDAELWAGGSETIHARQYRRAMEQLAVVQMAPFVDLRGVASRVRQSGGGGALVLVTGVPDGELLDAHTILRRDYRTTLLLSAAEGHSTSEYAFHQSGTFTVTVAPGESWARAWSRIGSPRWRAPSAG